MAISWNHESRWSGLQPALFFLFFVLFSLVFSFVFITQSLGMISLVGFHCCAISVAFPSLSCFNWFAWFPPWIWLGAFTAFLWLWLGLIICLIEEVWIIDSYQKRFCTRPTFWFMSGDAFSFLGAFSSSLVINFLSLVSFYPHRERFLTTQLISIFFFSFWFTWPIHWFIIFIHIFLFFSFCTYRIRFDGIVSEWWNLIDFTSLTRTYLSLKLKVSWSRFQGSKCFNLICANCRWFYPVYLVGLGPIVRSDAINIRLARKNDDIWWIIKFQQQLISVVDNEWCCDCFAFLFWWERLSRGAELLAMSLWFQLAIRNWLERFELKVEEKRREKGMADLPRSIEYFDS